MFVPATIMLYFAYTYAKLGVMQIVYFFRNRRKDINPLDYERYQ
jgi:hypothetical protein